MTKVQDTTNEKQVDMAQERCNSLTFSYKVQEIVNR